MSQELIYTSAPKGLKLGARGFCTVASTPGMAKNLADRLESLSGYRHLYQPGSPEAHLNPVNFCYLKFTLGGQTHYVLSRIADAGLDYTQRTNKLAHHIVLQTSELSSAGPAWLASQPGVFETTWTRDPELLPNNHRPIPQGQLNTDICSAWKLVAGDAGWAGVLAEHILKNGSDEAYLIYGPGTDVLELLVEAQALLPSDQRWAATFSTYFTKLPPGVECRWRCVVEGSAEAMRARRSPGKLVIELTAAKPIASGGELVAVARDGPRVRESAKGEIEKTSMPPTADSPLDERPPTGWDSARLEPGSFASAGSRPPALPQRRHSGWVPIAIAKGLSGRERAIWVSVIVILLASLGGVTYYFSQVSVPVSGQIIPTQSQDVEVASNSTAMSSSTTKGKVSDEEPPQINSESQYEETAPILEPSEVKETTKAASDTHRASNTERKHRDIATETSMHATNSEARSTANPQKPPVPKDIFDDVKSEITLPALPDPSITIPTNRWDETIEIAKFPIARPPIETALVGPEDIGLALESKKDGRYYVQLGQRSPAVIHFDEEGKKLIFQWLNDARMLPKLQIEKIRASVLLLSVVRDDGSMIYRPVLLKSANRMHEPLKFNEALEPLAIQFENSGQSEGFIAEYRLVGVPGRNEVGNRRTMLRGDKTTLVTFGPEDTLQIQLTSQITSDAGSLEVDLYAKKADGKLLPFAHLLNAEPKRRRELLVDAVAEYVRATNQYWEAWAAKGVPMTTRTELGRNSNNEAARPTTVYSFDARAERKFRGMLKRQSLHYLHATEREIRKQSGKPRPVYLTVHEEMYPHLEEWTAIADEIRLHVEINLRIVRRLTIPNIASRTEVTVIQMGKL